MLRLSGVQPRQKFSYHQYCVTLHSEQKGVDRESEAMLSELMASEKGWTGWRTQSREESNPGPFACVSCCR